MNDNISLLSNTDIYLLDQIMKGRYQAPENVLDAGAGSGRNLPWFVHQGFQVYGIDQNPENVKALKKAYPYVPAEHFKEGLVESLPFPDDYFHHVISSAVLHFADSHTHFEQMFGEMIRVLKPGGSLFIRMTTDAGMGANMIAFGEGRFHLADGSDRYVLNRRQLDVLLLKHKLQLLEPFKSVLVESVRSMGIIVLGKM